MDKFELTESSMHEMWDLVVELFPIHRTLVNEGFRQSLAIIQKKLDLNILQYDSGTPVWDWIIPNEWNVREAYIADSNGKRVVDFAKNNLHLAAYSMTFSGKLTKKELFEHLWTLPEQPDAIPYRTLYYKTNEWKFCIAHRDLELFNDHELYGVHIDVDDRPGNLCIGEYYLPGDLKKEIVLSTYLCHPSMANDNLSGVAVAVETMKVLSSIGNRKYSYRLLILPESIGSITYLATHEDQLKNIVGGYVFSCCGDRGNMTYKKTYAGNSEIDQAAIHVLRNKYDPSNYQVRNFWPNGSDEQKFNAPGVRLPFGSFIRTPYSEFPEYHTSKDNLDFVSGEKLLDTLDTALKTLYVLDNNELLKNVCKGEPFLTKHGIYQSTSLKNPDRQSVAYLQRVISMEFDGTQSILDVAEKWGYSFENIYDCSHPFIKAGLLKVLG